MIGLGSGKLVNEQAVQLSPTIGWLLLACAVVVLLLGISQADRWRRLWLRTEDPRALGLFRILFAVFVLLNVGGLWEHFTFLFTDEGIFSTDTAASCSPASSSPATATAPASSTAAPSPSS